MELKADIISVLIENPAYFEGTSFGMSIARHDARTSVNFLPASGYHSSVLPLAGATFCGYAV
jgi:hypothetical protein